MCEQVLCLAGTFQEGGYRTHPTSAHKGEQKWSCRDVENYILSELKIVLWAITTTYFKIAHVWLLTGLPLYVSGKAQGRKQETALRECSKTLILQNMLRFGQKSYGSYGYGSDDTYKIWSYTWLIESVFSFELYIISKLIKLYYLQGCNAPNGFLRTHK